MSVPSFPGAPGRTMHGRRWLTLIRLLVAAEIVLAFAYIGWRWSASIAWERWYVAVPMGVAETYTLVGMCLFGLTLWRLQPSVAPRSAAEDIDVDSHPHGTIPGRSSGS